MLLESYLPDDGNQVRRHDGARNSFLRVGYVGVKVRGSYPATPPFSLANIFRNFRNFRIHHSCQG